MFEFVDQCGAFAIFAMSIVVFSNSLLVLQTLDPGLFVASFVSSKVDNLLWQLLECSLGSARRVEIEAGWCPALPDLFLK